MNRINDCLKNAVNLSSKIIKFVSFTALKEVYITPKRVFLVILFVVITSLSFFAGRCGRITEEKEGKIRGVDCSDLPRVSTSIYLGGWDGPPQYKIHIIDTNNYVIQIAGSLVKISSKLMTTMLEFVQKNSSFLCRVQLWVKADSKFEDLWRSIELCATQTSYFSLALNVADSKAVKSIWQNSVDFFDPPIERWYSKRFKGPSQVEVSTNMVVIGYWKKRVSVNNSDCSLEELKRMIPPRDSVRIVLLVSGECSVQDVIKMMEELNRHHLDESYLGLLPEEGTVKTGSIIRVITTDPW